MEKLADAQRAAQQEAIAPQAQADEERGGAQPVEQGSRGSDNLPTDQLVEGLTSMFEAMQGKAAKHQQCAAATTTLAGSFVFSQTSMRMPESFDGSFKVRKELKRKVLIFTSKMNAYFGQQRCL